MSRREPPDTDLEPAVWRISTDRLRYDEGRAVVDRLEQLDDSEAKESFDSVLAEFDERVDDE